MKLYVVDFGDPMLTTLPMFSVGSNMNASPILPLYIVAPNYESALRKATNWVEKEKINLERKFQNTKFSNNSDSIIDAEGNLRMDVIDRIKSEGKSDASKTSSSMLDSILTIRSVELISNNVILDTLNK